MNEMDLLAAIGEIDSSLLTRCEEEKIPYRKPIALYRKVVAACFCVCLLAAMIFPFFRNQIVSHSPSETGKTYTEQSKAGQDFIFVNMLYEIPYNHFNSSIYSNQEDFIPLSEIEMLEYFGIKLTAEDTLSYLKMEKDPSSGIYINGDGEVYQDVHAFVFTGNDKTEKLVFEFSKLSLLPFKAPQNRNSIKQSEINDIGVTVFRYVNQENADCYISEFYLQGIFCRLESHNLSQNDFTTALAAFLSENFTSSEKNAGAKDVHKITGAVTEVDENQNVITIVPNDNRYPYLCIEISDEQKSDFVLGVQVQIEYIGNPMTICRLWKQQVCSVTLNK